MAFTLEEITRAIETPDHEGRVGNMQNLVSGVNYPVIIGYLTGASNSLSGLQVDYLLYYWSPLKNLVADPEQIGAKEQLVLDLIYHPLLWRDQKMSFYRWLIHHLLQRPTRGMFQSFLAIMRKGGASNDEIFDVLVCFIGEAQEHFEVVNNTPVKDFLIDHARKRSKFALTSRGDSSWNQFYFELLEAGNPEHAKLYSQYGMFAYTNNPVVYFSQYKNGQYFPQLIEFLTNGSQQHRETISAKFNSAILLYEHDRQRFKDLIVTLSQQYLDFIDGLSYTSNEQYGNSRLLTEIKYTHVAYSTIAYHFLLLYLKNQVPHVLQRRMEKKRLFGHHTLQVLQYHLGNDAFPYVEHDFNSYDGYSAVSDKVSAMNLLRDSFDPPVYLSFIWKQLTDKSKQVRDKVVAIVANKDPEAETKAIELLENKNVEMRIAAAKILSHLSTPAAQQAVSAILDKETNDNARDILLQVVADSLPKQADEEFIQGIISAAAKRGKLKKPVEDWLEEAALPPLFNLNSGRVPDESIRFMLYRMSRIKEISSDIEARFIIRNIDREKAAPFALALITLFNEKNGKPEYKYLMVLAALLGNDAVVEKIRLTVDRWIEESRYKMAEYGVGALALQGSDKALRWVEWYSRKYKSKKANVGAAALAALEVAAGELGITTHELGDRIVPDFGFEGLFKHFKVDGEEYRAFIDSNFKIAFFNEDNKKLKSIPSAADAALKDEFKSIAKEVRDIVKSQSPRLEYYLIIQRRWTVEKWQQFFLNNPVMFIYATRLLWGVYDDKGTLSQTFLCNEDTSLQDINQDEMTPDETKYIGIVHPSQLNPEDRQQWKKLFFDLSIESIFPQLERPLPDLQGIDLAGKILGKFEGREMKPGSIRSTLERYGWHRGGVGDGGSVLSFNLLYPEKKLEAILEVEGVSVVYGFGAEEKLGRLYIRDLTKENKFSWGRQESDPDLIPFESVPGIFLHELLAAIEAIAPAEKKPDVPA